MRPRRGVSRVLLRSLLRSGALSALFVCSSSLIRIILVGVQDVLDFHCEEAAQPRHRVAAQSLEAEVEARLPLAARR